MFREGQGNPILTAFREREEARNVFALRQWHSFTYPSGWDNSICGATAGEVAHAHVVFSRLISIHASDQTEQEST